MYHTLSQPVNYREIFPKLFLRVSTVKLNLQLDQKCATTSLIVPSDMCAQQGFRSACALRKHVYSNILKQIINKKWKKKSDKNSNIFHISAQNIDCEYSSEPPRWGGSNEYPQSMFLSRNKKNNVYPCKLQFYYIKVGLKGVKII